MFRKIYSVNVYTEYQICKDNTSDGIDVHVFIKFNGTWESRIYCRPKCCSQIEGA